MKPKETKAWGAYDKQGNLLNWFYAACGVAIARKKKDVEEWCEDHNKNAIVKRVKIIPLKENK